MDSFFEGCPMTDERITGTQTPSDDFRSTHTPTADGAPRANSARGWLIALVLVLAAVIGLYFFSR